MARFAYLLALLLLALGGCARIVERLPSPTRVPPTRTPATLPAEPSAATLACQRELTDLAVLFRPLPDRDAGGGCILVGTVQLRDYGVPTTNLGAMTCPLARAFVAWARNALVPAGTEILGSPVVRVETMGTYACRNRVGTASAARLSEHATANAVDVSAFVLADGRRITILGDWRNPDTDVRRFLEAIHRSACRRFRTVLSPDYNAAHANHLHLDLGGAALCR